MTKCCAVHASNSQEPTSKRTKEKKNTYIYMYIVQYIVQYIHDSYSFFFFPTSGNDIKLQLLFLFIYLFIFFQNSLKRKRENLCTYNT